MTGCEEFRGALGRLHDGEASAEEAQAARAHAGSCAACRADTALLESVAARLRERAGPVPAPEDAVPGLREAVVARALRGEAAVLDLGPFLRRAAAAAAAVLVAATASALWQAAHRSAVPASPDPPSHAEIVAQIVRLRMGAGR
jgi:anti-sigma factor RsiW